MKHNKIHCFICDKKHTIDPSDKRKVYYFKEIYFSQLCSICQTNYEICEYCNKLHWKNDPNDNPICEPVDPGLKEL